MKGEPRKRSNRDSGAQKVADFQQTISEQERGCSQEMILFEPRTMKQEFPAPFAAAAGLFCINGGIHD
ncbi:hypothetical protein Y1Q_0006317 [Alligator mississippiensis]|uniref:Uncharacterized protein n=1 Tax=Alligator mississippiensis TaxID=8496 RepID=A0A151NXC0_ALLMI|nr:hypothetical protein Y1Q_0006317 [Alligator mississippiensis]